MNEFQEALLSLEYNNERSVQCVMSAVSPDNMIPGQGLVVDMWGKGRVLYSKMNCERGISSLVSTLDDLIMSIKIAEDILQVMKDYYPEFP